VAGRLICSAWGVRGSASGGAAHIPLLLPGLANVSGEATQVPSGAAQRGRVAQPMSPHLKKGI